MSRNKTVKIALQEGKNFLKEHQVENFAFECEWLLMDVIGMSRVQLFTQEDRELSDKEEETFYHFLQERKNGKPLQYILGKCEFMGLDFFVNESVLVPRQDTEILVEAVLEYAKKESLTTMLDMGTGSGCIPISLDKYGKLKGYGVDISADALKVARKNAEFHQCSIQWIESNLFFNVPKELIGTLDILISNPPYIPTEDILELMCEVKDYEPRNALDGGADGLDFYRILVKEGKDFLRKEGRIFFEIGYNQAQDVVRLLEKAEFSEIEVRQDLAGLDRVVIAKY